MKPLRDLLRGQQTVTVGPDISVREAAKAMAEANVGCVAILDGSSLAGLFTERDILKRVLLADLRTDIVKVCEVMTRDIVTATAEMSSAQGRELMHNHHVRHLPVLDDGGALIGILSIRDLIQDEVREAREAVQEVTRFLQGGEAFEGEIDQEPRGS